MIGEGTFVNISGVATTLARERHVGKDQEVRARFLGRLDKVMDETGPGNELVNLLEGFKRDGIRMGIVSFMRRPRLLRRLELWKLTSFFQAVVTPEQVSEFKPSPQPFLTAIRELKLRPANCFVIGDEPVDMTGGKRAGTKTIGLPQGFFSADELREAGADRVVSSISLLPSVLKSP